MARDVLNKSKLSEYDDSIYERVMQHKKEPIMYRVSTKFYKYIDIDLLMMSVGLNLLSFIGVILCVYSGLINNVPISFFNSIGFLKALVMGIIIWYLIFNLSKNQLNTDFKILKIFLLGKR